MRRWPPPTGPARTPPGPEPDPHSAYPVAGTTPSPRARAAGARPTVTLSHPATDGLEARVFLWQAGEPVAEYHAAADPHADPAAARFELAWEREPGEAPSDGLWRNLVPGPELEVRITYARAERRVFQPGSGDLAAHHRNADLLAAAAEALLEAAREELDHPATLREEVGDLREALARYRLGDAGPSPYAWCTDPACVIHAAPRPHRPGGGP
jgi:hypothetical protein